MHVDCFKGRGGERGEVHGEGGRIMCLSDHKTPGNNEKRFSSFCFKRDSSLRRFLDRHTASLVGRFGIKISFCQGQQLAEMLSVFS